MDMIDLDVDLYHFALQLLWKCAYTPSNLFSDLTYQNSQAIFRHPYYMILAMP